jgi:hypothetical protein
MVRRDSFFRAGLFETNWKVGEFASWFLRAREMGLKSRMLTEHVAWRRIHGKNHGVEARDSIHDYVRILKASLDRRRAAGPETEKTTD